MFNQATVTLTTLILNTDRTPQNRKANQNAYAAYAAIPS